MNIFDKISQPNKSAILQCIGAVSKEYNKGDLIISPGENDSRIGIIEKGSVQMLSEDLWGNRSLLCVLGSEELIGETFACAKKENYLILFEAASSCRILFMDYARVLHSCNRCCNFHHRLIENMVQIIAGKNLKLLKKIHVVSGLHLRDKILTFLSQYAAAAGSDTFTLPMGRTKMAEYLCADRSSLTRELSKMKAEGLISYEKDTFTIAKSFNKRIFIV